jgi:hypothetical protein
LSLRSTSWLAIDGDRRLGPVVRVGYLAGNALRNALSRAPGGLALERFAGAATRADEAAPSPSRLLCEHHLASIGLEGFAAAAGGLRMHEMGCGSGRAGRLASAAAGAPIRYRGFDVARRAAWDEPMPGASMAVFDGEDFAGTIAPDDNFFFSQSAAEHIPGDLAYFEAVARACARAPGPTLQVHYLPSAACLRLYLFHGLRQYPLAALRRIAALQAPDARSVAVALGGPACAAVHWRWITLPMIRRRPDRRAADPRAYARELAAAIAADAAAPPGKAMFWAFVVRRGFPSHPVQEDDR